MNMDATVENADLAHQEVLQARNYQKSTSKWLVWLLVIVLVVTLIIVLSVVLGKK